MFSARVLLQGGYPKISPLWTLQLDSEPDMQSQVVIPSEFALMMASQVDKVEQQRGKKRHLQNGELV